MDASGDAQRQLFSLVIAAPEPLRQRFRGHKLPAMLRLAARIRISPRWDAETATTARVLRDLAQRALALGAEAARHEKDILALVRRWRPDLLAQFGVGPITAATILCAWSHPGRIRSEAAFAMLGGAAPIPADSGGGRAPVRFRFNRYGDRQLNRALHTIALARLRYDPATQAYAQRRTAEGKTPARSNAASSATSPGTSTASWRTHPCPLTIHRSVPCVATPPEGQVSVAVDRGGRCATACDASLRRPSLGVPGASPRLCGKVSDIRQRPP